MIRNCKDVISTIKHRGDMMGRLEELRRKTDIWCDQNVPRDVFFGLRWEEKFYELIVQDALRTIDLLRDSMDADGSKEEALGAQWAAMAIARHFGVE